MVIPSLDAPSWMFSKALSHRQKVMRLYKRCRREIDAYYGGGDCFEFLECRFQHVLMRARFDANKDVEDMRLAQYLLADGCREVWSIRHRKPFRFCNDPRGGTNNDRDYQPPDQIADDGTHYNFPEREAFPYYFNRREQRKKELLDHWHKIEEAWDTELDSIQRSLPAENGEDNNNKSDTATKEPPPVLH